MLHDSYNSDSNTELYYCFHLNAIVFMITPHTGTCVARGFLCHATSR